MGVSSIWFRRCFHTGTRSRKEHCSQPFGLLHSATWAGSFLCGCLLGYSRLWISARGGGDVDCCEYGGGIGVAARELDLIGKRYGRLLVKKLATPRVDKNGRPWKRYMCKCDCGMMKMVSAAGLRSGDTKSCGCLHKDVQFDLAGKRFGLLTVVKRLPNRLVGNSMRVSYLCRCNCGRMRESLASNLRGRSAAICGRDHGKPL